MQTDQVESAKSYQSLPPKHNQKTQVRVAVLFNIIQPIPSLPTCLLGILGITSVCSCYLRARASEPASCSAYPVTDGEVGGGET